MNPSDGNGQVRRHASNMDERWIIRTINRKDGHIDVRIRPDMLRALLDTVRAGMKARTALEPFYRRMFQVPYEGRKNQQGRIEPFPVYNALYGLLGALTDASLYLGGRVERSALGNIPDLVIDANGNRWEPQDDDSDDRPIQPTSAVPVVTNNRAAQTLVATNEPELELEPA